jgi:hydrogenase maturation protease
MNPSILVAGVGNIFLGDDAFGVEVVQRLVQRPLPEHVRVMDFGIRSYDLAYALMEPWKLAILVDAVSCGEPPGTLYTIQPELPSAVPATVNVDAHSMDPASVLQIVAALGGSIGRMLVVGCEPDEVHADTGALGLSDAVAAAVDEAVRLIEELIERELNHGSATAA